MYCAVRWRMAPLFFSVPGTIFAMVSMPSLMTSRRRRSTRRGKRELWRIVMVYVPSLCMSFRLLCHSAVPTLGLVGVWLGVLFMVG